jgi:uncharacterized protein YjbJ (UPF0337 family)
MNKLHIKGTWKEPKSGDSKLESEAMRQHIKGKFEKRVADVKDAVKKGVDSLLKKV